MAALVNSRQAVQETAAQVRESGAQVRLNQQTQINGQFNTAISDLGSGAMDERLGGIYVLQSIMRSTPAEQPVVINVLSAFIRDHAPATPPPAAVSPIVANDVQAALTVLANRNPSHDDGTFINLDHTDLAGADLASANLSGADLLGTDLSDANLLGADLTNANINDSDNFYLGTPSNDNTDLSGANLGGADLSNADFTDADFSGTNLSSAQLYNLDADGADFSAATAHAADLSCAGLALADLDNANFSQSINLDSASLSDAKLSGTVLWGATRTKTPPGCPGLAR